MSNMKSRLPGKNGKKTAEEIKNKLVQLIQTSFPCCRITPQSTKFWYISVIIMMDGSVIGIANIMSIF